MQRKSSQRKRANVSLQRLPVRRDFDEVLIIQKIMFRIAAKIETTANQDCDVSALERDGVSNKCNLIR